MTVVGTNGGAMSVATVAVRGGKKRKGVIISAATVSYRVFEGITEAGQ